MQAYHVTASQPIAFDFDIHSAPGAPPGGAGFPPFAVLTRQCIPVCCASATMTTPAHVPMNTWPYPAPCNAPGIQLIPCCDGAACVGQPSSASRQFYGRLSAVGPYHCPQVHQHHHHHHHHHRQRLPPPPSQQQQHPHHSVPMATSVYQSPAHLGGSSFVPPSLYATPQPQQQQRSAPQHITGTPSHHMYTGHGMTPTSSTQSVYRPSPVLTRPHAVEEPMQTDANVTFPSLSSHGVYQRQTQQQPQPPPTHAHPTLGAHPLILHPVPGDFINGSFSHHYRPVTSSRQRWTTYQTVAAPYSGYLLPFLAMLGRPTAVVSTSLHHHHRASLQPDDFADLDSYEALLNLAERLGEAKSRGLSRSDIDRLHCYRYSIRPTTATTGDTTDDIATDVTTLDQTSCVVCLCDFEQRELVRALPCRHEFHANCVDRWLKMNRTCPLCRADVTEVSKMDVE